MVKVSEGLDALDPKRARRSLCNFAVSALVSQKRPGNFQNCDCWFLEATALCWLLRLGWIGACSLVSSIGSGSALPSLRPAGFATRTARGMSCPSWGMWAGDAKQGERLRMGRQDAPWGFDGWRFWQKSFLVSLPFASKMELGISTPKLEKVAPLRIINSTGVLFFFFNSCYLSGTVLYITKHFQQPTR